MCVCVCALSCIQLFVIPWTVVRWAPLSLRLSRQEYWRGMPFLPPGDLPDPGVNPRLLGLLHWQAGSLPLVFLTNLRPEGRTYILKTTPLTQSFSDFNVQRKIRLLAVEVGPERLYF